MSGTSRTGKSIKNSTVTMVYYGLNILLAFYSRKIFLDYLGAEVLGLNTTAVNILQFLNLAELGIGASITFSLYKPLHNKDFDTINEIVTMQGMLYRRIAMLIIGGAAVVMCFFPWIFSKMTLPLWYAYASFGAMLFSSLLGYFINYRQIVLGVAQMGYKIQINVGTYGFICTICQILAVRYAPHPYVWWLVLKVVFAIFASVMLQRTIRKYFPQLAVASMSYRQLKEKYGEILTKTKQVFIHNIGGFALSQSSPLVIYAYASLTMVAFYGNYMAVITGAMNLVNAVFSSVAAGVGDLVAEGDKNKIKKVFYEIFSMRFLLASTIVFSILMLGQNFITLWLGAEYLLGFSSLAIMSATLFIRLNRYTVFQFLCGYGLFQDVWSPITEASINLGLSILLGYFFGLNGILSGVLISLIVIIEVWKPIFLFRDGFKQSIWPYVFNYAIHIGIALVVGLSIYYVANRVLNVQIVTWLQFLVLALCCVGAFILITAMLLFAFTQGFRDFTKRLLQIKHLI